MRGTEKKLETLKPFTNRKQAKGLAQLTEEEKGGRGGGAAPTVSVKGWFALICYITPVRQHLKLSCVDSSGIAFQVEFLSRF